MKRERSRMLLLGDHDWVRSKEAVWKWKYVLRKILRSVGVGIWPGFFMSLEFYVKKWNKNVRMKLVEEDKRGKVGKIDILLNV